MKSLLLLFLIVFVLYANILPNPFVWDDNIFILQNKFIRDWKNIPLLFQSDFFSKSPGEAQFLKGGYYRPLVMLFYTFEFSLWGERPLFYHLVSILLHCTNVFLVYFLIQRLLQNRKISFLGALLFAAHPLHTETISYLPSRGDLFAALFSLAALLSFSSSRRFLEGASTLFFALALLSKESAVILPLVLFIFSKCFPGDKKRERRVFCLYGLILLGYGIARLFLFPIPLKTWFAGNVGLIFRILSLGKLILSYFSLLIFPYPLYLERLAPVQRGFWDLGTLGFAAVVGGAFWVGKKFWRENKPLCFAWLWFFVTLLPVSNIVPLHPPMAEHYLYFPSVGLFGVIAFLIYQFFIGIRSRRDRKILLSIGSLVMIFYGFMIIDRNRDYSDELRLFTQTAIHSPQSPLIHNNLGSIYVSRGLVEQAEAEFKKSLSLNPEQPEALANLGTVYRQKKSYEEAISFFLKALELDEESAAIWNKIGIAYAESGKEDQAVEAFLQAIRKDPLMAEAYFNVGSYYWRKGEFQKTLFFWEEGLKKDPNHAVLKEWLSLLKEKMPQEGH